MRECLVALALIPDTLLLLVVALLPRDADRYSIDHWLDRRRAAVM